MKRFSMMLLSATVLATAAAAGSVPLTPLIGGRVAVQTTKAEGFSLFGNAADKTVYTYQWPGVYFEARFDGPEVDVKVDDNQNDLYVYVDGSHKFTLTKPGKTTVSLTNLGLGPHVVRLEKVSETQGSVGRFEGFFVGSASEALPPPVYDKRIEFIGDSFTVGYGNVSRGTTCTVDDVAETTNTSRAFGPEVAKSFGADYRIMAFSGRGVVRNYNGMAPGETLPVLYNYTLFDKSVAAPNDGWVPDVIVIGLGTNDFSTDLHHPEEPWVQRGALDADFARTYADFIGTLHGKYPAAHLILMASDGAKGEIAGGMSKAAELAKAAGVTGLETIEFKGLDYQACHGHPSLKDEAILSGLLKDSIAKLPKFAK